MRLNRHMACEPRSPVANLLFLVAMATLVVVAIVAIAGGVK